MCVCVSKYMCVDCHDTQNGQGTTALRIALLPKPLLQQKYNHLCLSFLISPPLLFSLSLVHSPSVFILFSLFRSPYPDRTEPIMPSLGHVFAAAVPMR